ncbi:ATP-grasp domain-containing protein [Luteimonas sp. MJ174]|uniref:ATP-grasp domain-containing protein n=1 Tax=Luteimonas sp. MJ174 TaxID=3129237 RepID=UPI0031BAD911
MLVFPAGTEIGLEIHAALYGFHDIRIFGAGEPESSPARFVFAEYHEVRNVHTEGWLEQLVALCKKLQIHYIFPAHDDVVVALSAERARIPATIITSSNDFCQTTRSKSATYRRLEGIVPVPRLYLSADEVAQYPVLVKPDRGQGSSGVQRVDNAEDLMLVLRQTAEPIICEYLPGDEYTVDCFSSGTDGLLFAGARRRNRMRNGISVNSDTVELPEARALATAIDCKLKPRGAWFFQLKRSAEEILTLLEVAPRIAGTMAVHRVSGVNFPRLSLLDAEGHHVQILTNPGGVEVDRALCNRYRSPIRFNTLYVDLDDTLLRDKILDESVMRLICRCLNQEIHLVLITERDPTVGGMPKIASLFNEVVQVQPTQPRSDFLCEASAIYVDNSFHRRLEVNRSKNIPTFDVSMIELLHCHAQDAKLKESTK